MKVIIAGSRGIDPTHNQIEKCVELSGFDVEEIVCGGARGVDRAGKEWAEYVMLPVVTFYADWETFGKSAGSIRNKKMGLYADALIAIWDCESHGTAHMIRHMIQLEKPLAVFILDQRTKEAQPYLISRIGIDNLLLPSKTK